MYMTILRAQRSLEMDVDLEHMTEVPNMDRDEYGIAMYGKETKSGELYYVLLDNDTINEIVRLRSLTLEPGGYINTDPQVNQEVTGGIT